MSHSPPTTKAASAPKAPKVAPKAHKKPRGISKWETSLPSRAERLRSVGPELTLTEAPWATVSIRAPLSTTRPAGGPYATVEGDRAALSFVDPQFVDARSGWAKWKGAGGLGLPGNFPGPSSEIEQQIDELECALLGIGCGDDDADDDVDLHLWVKATAGHDYLAVCRVKFDDSAGELEIVSEGASTMSVQIDHTGEQSDTVSFVIDAAGAGWYGVALSSGEAWSTTGCTVDEV